MAPRAQRNGQKEHFEVPTSNDGFPFYKEILENGYHVFGVENERLPDYYPNRFPDYPGVDLQHLHIGKELTIRVFFRVGAGATLRADGGLLDLEVEHIEDDTVFGVILTELSKEFHLQTGDSLEVYPDEILYKTEGRNH